MAWIGRTFYKAVSSLSLAFTIFASFTPSTFSESLSSDFLHWSSQQQQAEITQQQAYACRVQYSLYFQHHWPPLYCGNCTVVPCTVPVVPLYCGTIGRLYTVWLAASIPYHWPLLYCVSRNCYSVLFLLSVPFITHRSGRPALAVRRPGALKCYQ